MQPTPTRTQQLAWLVTKSFALAIIATIFQIGIVLANIDIYLLNQPPLQLIDWQASILRGTATLATAIGVVGTLILFILKRRDKALAAAEKAREDPWNRAGKAADKLKGVPEQISRVRSGLGCLGTYSIAVACISVVTLTITLTPPQAVSQALGYNGQLSGPAAIPPFVVSSSHVTPLPGGVTPIPSFPGGVTPPVVPTVPGGTTSNSGGTTGSGTCLGLSAFGAGSVHLTVCPSSFANVDCSSNNYPQVSLENTGQDGANWKAQVRAASGANVTLLPTNVGSFINPGTMVFLAPSGNDTNPGDTISLSIGWSFDSQTITVVYNCR